jgi:hypothetical protein
MPAYQWLLPDPVGEVVEWSENLLYKLTPDVIELLLAGAGDKIPEEKLCVLEDPVDCQAL